VECSSFAQQARRLVVDDPANVVELKMAAVEDTLLLHRQLSAVSANRAHRGWLEQTYGTRVHVMRVDFNSCLLRSFYHSDTSAPA